MAKEVAGLIGALRLARPIVLGHSMGGMIALVLACLYPTLARGYILEDPPPFWISGGLTPEDHKNRGTMLSGFERVKRQTKEELLTITRQENPVWSEVELGPWADSKQRFSPKIARLIEFDQKAGSMEWQQCLKRVDCPFMVITADQEYGSVLGGDEVSDLKKILARSATSPNCGSRHNIHREKFPQYMDAVEEFITAC